MLSERMKIYAGGSQNPWRKWLEEHGPNDEVKVKTVLDRQVLISTNNTSRWDWTTKYWTTDCSTCPMLISREQAEKITKRLRFHGNSNKSVPKNLEGICIYRQTRKITIKKFLVPNPWSPIEGCKIGKKNIQKRLDSRTNSKG